MYVPLCIITYSNYEIHNRYFLLDQGFMNGKTYFSYDLCVINYTYVYYIYQGFKLGIY